VSNMEKVCRFLIPFLFVLLLVCATCNADPQYDPSPVTKSHLLMITSLFSENGLSEASVKLDRYGRVELSGGYKDKREVEIAFSLAQSVAGVRWVSPVIPENIKVKEWAKKIAALFPTNRIDTPSLPREDAGSRTGATKYALVVGIGKFKNNEQYIIKHDGRRMDLKYADKDANEVYAYLTDPRHGNFPKENVQLLINENATKMNMERALDDLRSKVRSRDTVVLYFSSHGYPTYDGAMNIVTYDSEVAPPYRVADTSLKSDNLRDFILETKAKSLVVILDVCFSGNAFSNIKGFYHPGAKIDYSKDTQGISGATMAKSLMGAKDFTLDDDVAKPSDLQKRDGTRVLISASGAGEQSWESDTLRSGVFTSFFLKGLETNADVKQAFEYAKPRVIKQVQEEKKHDQHPQVATDKENWNIRI